MDRLFGLESPRDMGEELPLLASFFDPVSLAIAEEMLNDAKIPYLNKERGCGGAVRILVGYQSFGTDLYVKKEDEERAGDLLAPLFEQTEQDGEEIQEENEG